MWLGEWYLQDKRKRQRRKAMVKIPVVVVLTGVGLYTFATLAMSYQSVAILAGVAVLAIAWTRICKRRQRQEEISVEKDAKEGRR